MIRPKDRESHGKDHGQLNRSQSTLNPKLYKALLPLVKSLETDRFTRSVGQQAATL